MHAISVKSKLEYIENIDKRLEIVCEDCRSFPYGYTPKIDSQKEFDETLAFAEKVVNLRGRGKTGLVYKGLMTLDWNSFAHQSGHYIMGENSKKTADNYRTKFAPTWRKFTADWLVYGKYVYDFTKKLHETDCKNVNLNIAAQLADGVWFPFALLAEILWSTDDSYDEILNRMTKRKIVIF